MLPQTLLATFCTLYILLLYMSSEKNAQMSFTLLDQHYVQRASVTCGGLGARARDSRAGERYCRVHHRIGRGIAGPLGQVWNLPLQCGDGHDR